MIYHRLSLKPLPGLYAVCRLKPDAPLPTWADSAVLLSITRTTDELSVVCPQELVPVGVKCERDWRCLRVAGTMDFSTVGVLVSLLSPLAEAGVGIFALSTFDTDYLLVKEADYENVINTLEQFGHSITE